EDGIGGRSGEGGPVGEGLEGKGNEGASSTSAAQAGGGAVVGEEEIEGAVEVEHEGWGLSRTTVTR
ncbi:hypothetical protein Dimus_003088, partial [Dionaea muscipula]